MATLNVGRSLHNIVHDSVLPAVEVITRERVEVA